MVDEEPLRECATSKSLFIIHLLVKSHVSNMKFPFFSGGQRVIVSSAKWFEWSFTDLERYCEVH